MGSFRITLEVYAHLPDGGLGTVGEPMPALLPTVPDTRQTGSDYRK